MIARPPASDRSPVLDRLAEFGQRPVDRPVLPLGVQPDDVGVPQRLDRVGQIGHRREERALGRTCRRCRSSAWDRARAKPRRPSGNRGGSSGRGNLFELLRTQIRLDPGVGVQLPHVVIRVRGISNRRRGSRSPCGPEFLGCEASGQGAGEIFAMPARIAGHEIFDRIESGLRTASAIERVFERRRARAAVRAAWRCA